MRRTMIAAFAALLVLPAAAEAQSSSVAPLSGTAACVAQQDAGASGCTDGRGLQSVRDVAVAPDGADVYAVSGGGREAGSNAVVQLRRDAATGALTAAGCISDDGGDGRLGSDGICTDGDALQGGWTITVAPDGTSVYVGSITSTSISTFRRDPQTGALTQVGCEQTYRRGNACDPAPALDGVNDLSVSPDGRNLYATSGADGALITFTRDPETGELTFASCLSETGMDGACEDGTALRGARGVEVAPDGAAVYVTATMGAVTTYARDPETGALTRSGCLLQGAPKNGPCTDTDVLAGARSLTLSPDGAYVYVASSATTAIPDAPPGVLTILKRGAEPTDLRRVGCLAYAAPSGDDAVNRPDDDEQGDDEDEGDDDRGDDDEGRDDDEDAEDARIAQAGCAPAKAITSVDDLAISADGTALFAASSSGALAAFRRDADTGALTQTGCAEATPTYRSCAAAPLQTGAEGLATTSDGRSLYVAGAGRVSAFGAAVAVSAASRRLAAHGRVAVRLRCPKARKGGCRGRVGVAARGAHARAYRLKAGARRTLRVQVPARLRRAGHGHRLRLRVRATDARRLVRPTTKRVALRR